MFQKRSKNIKIPGNRHMYQTCVSAFQTCFPLPIDGAVEISEMGSPDGRCALSACWDRGLVQ
eukprot:2687047-Alexandrium_andersonii.AAC.1